MLLAQPPTVSAQSEPRYSIQELTRWYDELRDPVFELPGLVATDLDEVAHVLRYSVVDDASGASLATIVEARGVPEDAIVINVMSRASIGDPIAVSPSANDSLSPPTIWLVLTGAVVAPILLLVAARWVLGRL